MGLLGGLLGGASVDLEALEEELEAVLLDGEEVEAAFKFSRDLFVFTTKRLIFVDRESLAGKRVEYRSIPYRSIHQFSVETSGRSDREAELSIWIAGEVRPFAYEFKRGADIVGLHRTLARYVL